MPEKSHFLGALKRIRPVQRPKAWEEQPDKLIQEILRSEYTPKFQEGKVGDRALSIPTVHDRIIQGAIQLELYPKWEIQQNPVLIARKGTQRTLQDTKDYISREQSGYFFKSDVKGFFTALNKDATKQVCQEVFCYSGWTKQAVEATIDAAPEGIPQGSPLSPLLADAVMLHLDNSMLETQDCFYLRYVDDILVLANNQTVLKQCQDKIEKYLKKFQLNLNESKTTIGKYPDDSFSLLGEKFFQVQDTNILLSVQGGSEAFGLSLFPNEVSYHRTVVNSGASRQEKGGNIIYTRDHVLNTLLDKPHPDILELLISPKVLQSSSWGDTFRAEKDQFLHKGFGKALHDYAFKMYVGKVKPAKEEGKPIPLKEASAVLRSLLLGNEILQNNKFPKDLSSYNVAYSESLVDLQKGNFETYHIMVSKLFKDNYQFRKNTTLPETMPYYQQIQDGEDMLEI